MLKIEYLDSAICPTSNDTTLVAFEQLFGKIGFSDHKINSFSEMWGSQYIDSYYDHFRKQEVKISKLDIYGHTPKMSKFERLQRCFDCSK